MEVVELAVETMGIVMIPCTVTMLSKNLPNQAAVPLKTMKKRLSLAVRKKRSVHVLPVLLVAISDGSFELSFQALTKEGFFIAE